MLEDWKNALAGLNLPEGADNEEMSHDITKDSCLQKPLKVQVTIFYETKGRNGKPVTILADFRGIDADAIDDLASELKKKLGVGGSCRDEEILIQGDRRKEVRVILENKGFRVKGGM